PRQTMPGRPPWRQRSPDPLTRWTPADKALAAYRPALRYSQATPLRNGGLPVVPPRRPGWPHRPTAAATQCTICPAEAAPAESATVLRPTRQSRRLSPGRRVVPGPDSGRGHGPSLNTYAGPKAAAGFSARQSVLPDAGSEAGQTGWRAGSQMPAARPSDRSPASEGDRYPADAAPPPPRLQARPGRAHSPASVSGSDRPPELQAPPPVGPVPVTVPQAADR